MVHTSHVFIVLLVFHFPPRRLFGLLVPAVELVYHNNYTPFLPFIHSFIHSYHTFISIGLIHYSNSPRNEFDK